MLIITQSPVAEYCDEYVCLSLCVSAYLWNHCPNFAISQACYLQPWLGHALAAMRYTMYFCFYGWHHISNHGSYRGTSIPLQRCHFSVMCRLTPLLLATGCNLFVQRVPEAEHAMCHCPAYQIFTWKSTAWVTWYNQYDVQLFWLTKCSKSGTVSDQFLNSTWAHYRLFNTTKWHRMHSHYTASRATHCDMIGRCKELRPRCDSRRQQSHRDKSKCNSVRHCDRLLAPCKVPACRYRLAQHSWLLPQTNVNVNVNSRLI